jgi:hypothetical protein
VCSAECPLPACMHGMHYTNRQRCAALQSVMYVEEYRPSDLLAADDGECVCVCVWGGGGDEQLPCPARRAPPTARLECAAD